jgi:hypothetical protein
VIDVARRFRTAKEVVAEHRDYVLRLKTEVFGVRFGSVGVRVPVRCKAGSRLTAIRRMTWNEFCETHFAVSADWINRICQGKAESPGQASAVEDEQPSASLKPFKLDSRQQADLVKSKRPIGRVATLSRRLPSGTLALPPRNSR